MGKYNLNCECYNQRIQYMGSLLKAERKTVRCKQLPSPIFDLLSGGRNPLPANLHDEAVTLL